MLNALFVSSVVLAQAGPKPLDVPAIDRYVTAVMTEWKVTGLSVGIIRDGQVVLAKGYGYRDVEQKLPVTPRTLMAIGSNTKSFTTVLMAMLADSGKLDWEKPVRDYLPDFQLWDAYATREMTPRDLVSHVSGLPRHDLLWYGRNFTRPELYQRLRYLEPSTSFRGRLQYNNLMFMTAGILTERLTGKSWDDQVRDRIFAPLGMTRAMTSSKDLARADDFAWPYGLVDGAVARLPVRIIDNAAPAGSIVASVEDMLKYVQFRIDSGKAGGRQVMSAKSEARLTTPLVAAPGFEGEDAELEPTTYAMGLAITNYRGYRLVMHGGGIDGFISQMAWLPRERIGIVVLTNFSGAGDTPVPNFLTYHLYDVVLGLDPVDWVARARKASLRGKTSEDSAIAARAAERKPGTQPSHPLASYAGNYEHPGYGTISIVQTGDRLEMVLDSHHAPLRHFHYDVFEMGDPRSLVPLNGRVTFLTNGKGEVDRIAVPLEGTLPDLIFVRKTG